MAFSPQFLDELSIRIGLADVISRRVKLTRKGREHSGLCPFHKEKTPSFTVSEEKGFYHCFGCGAHGGAIDFVMNTENVPFPEAVERLAGEAGMEIPVDSPQERERSQTRQTLLDVTEAAAVLFEKILRMPEGKAAHEYLRQRGLNEDTIKNFRLGYAPDSKGTLKGALAREGISEERMIEAGLIISPEDKNRTPYDRFRGRVMFPITDRRGRVIAFGGRILGEGNPKYLNSPETPLFHKGQILYGLAQAAPHARKAGSVIVTEGYTDVIALAQAGFPNTVAPLGTALTEEQITALWRIAPEPIMCFDGDNAGQRAAIRAAGRALEMLKPGYSLRFAVLPKGEDPDSLIKNGGPEAMNALISAASPLSETLWRVETGGRAVKTPEDRAALQKRMEDHAKKINDPIVRSHFLSDIKKRLWVKHSTSKAKKRHDFAMAPPFDTTSLTGIPVNQRHDDEKTLIAAIINHPNMFFGVEDKIGSIRFNNFSLEDLRESLINILSENPNLDVVGLKDAIKNQGKSKSLDNLFNDDLIKNHHQISPKASETDARITWEQSFRHLQTPARDLELKESISDNVDQDSWKRFQALKIASLEDGDD